MQYYINIKEQKIPVIIRNYKKSYKIKIFFKGNTLNISKPTFVKIEEVMQMIKQNENNIYNQYMKITSSKNTNIKQWVTGEKIYYKGTELNIIRQIVDKNIDTIQVLLKQEEKKLLILVPNMLENKDIKQSIDKGIKDLLKNNTQAMLGVKLPYWSNITNIKYNEFKVRDAVSKFGSCIKSKKLLHFTSRLIMLPEDKIDAIIVHELCHIVHANHGNDFYNLVKKFIPNYSDIDKWLKDNSNLIMF